MHTIVGQDSSLNVTGQGSQLQRAVQCQRQTCQENNIWFIKYFLTEYVFYV